MPSVIIQNNVHKKVAADGQHCCSRDSWTGAPLKKIVTNLIWSHVGKGLEKITRQNYLRWQSSKIFATTAPQMSCRIERFHICTIQGEEFSNARGYMVFSRVLRLLMVSQVKFIRSMKLCGILVRALLFTLFYYTSPMHSEISSVYYFS